MIIKMHKNPTTVRCIINTRNTPTYYASKFLHIILAPIMRKGKSYLKNSQDLIQILESTKYNQQDITLVSADVNELYPSIPIHDGLNALKFTISKENWNEDQINFIYDLAEFVLTNNIFTFKDKTYIQIFGTAMGTCFAVAYANIFLDHLEHQVWKKFTKDINFNKAYYPFMIKRYIADILAIFPSKDNDSSAKLYVNIYNNMFPSIKLTTEMSSEQINILDITIFKGQRFLENNILDIKTFQKPINKYLYIPQSSFHSSSIKKGFISSELRRYRLNCSNHNDFLNIKNLFFQRLLKREYSALFLNKIFNKNLCRNTILEQIENNNQSNTKDNKSIPNIFKIKFNTRIKNKEIKQCIHIPQDLTQHPQFLSIFKGQQPTICNIRNRNIQNILISN